MAEDDVTIDDVHLAGRILEEDRRIEKEIQADVVKLYRAYSCTVYSLSQPRASKQSPGIPDLWIVRRASTRAWWHETKTATGKQSPAQEDFELDCLSTGTGYVLGGIKAAEDQLVRISAAERQLSGELEPKREIT